MKIKVNGNFLDVADGESISALVERTGVNRACVVVEYNRQILSSEDWSATTLKEGDCLELVTFVGGG